MPKPTKGNRLGGSPAHQRIILANLASQLFEHGRITTTETRAKRMQPLAERLIAKAKRGDLHSRRVVKRTITNPDIVHELFAEIAPKMAGREGGYTRITKVGPRKGDNAPMVVIELVTEPVKSEPKKSAKKAESKPAEEQADFKTVDQAADDAAEADAPVDEKVTDEAVAEEAVADEQAAEPAESADSAESAESAESAPSAESADDEAKA